MTDQELLAAILFSETKDPLDALAIANVVKNRAMRPNRFGEGIQGVLTKPKQFSGYGSKEYKKAVSGKLTAEEKKILKKFEIISKNVIIGLMGDTTGGADHYFNPKLVKPSWAKDMTKMYQTDSHEYYKE